MTNLLLLHCIYYIGFDFSNENLFEVTLFVLPYRVLPASSSKSTITLNTVNYGKTKVLVLL